MTHTTGFKSGHERRRFERVDVQFSSRIRVTDTKGHVLGVLRQIGRGGLSIEPDREFKKDKKVKLVISDGSEKMRFQVNAIVRYTSPRNVGFEFRDLDAEAAVDIGILIGKFYDKGR